MTEYEKVIKGLKCCSTPHKSCSKACPYNKDCYSEMDGEGITHLCADALKLLRGKPEQKHGHWIPVKQPTGIEAFGYKELTAQVVTCSKCGFTEDVMASAYLYCPKCGAKMDEVE